jgi:uncharacterized membrane protein
MKKLFFTFAVIPLLAASCCCDRQNPSGNPAVADVITLRDQVATAQTSLQGAQSPLDESGAHLDNAKVAVLTTNNPTAVVKELDAAKSKLQEGSSFITKASVQMLTALNTATQAVAAVQQTDRALKDEQAKNAELTKRLDSQKSWVFKLLLGIAAGLIVAGIGVCVASMVIGFASLKIGGLISGGGVALLVLTLTLQTYEKQLVIGCGILLLVVAAYFLWQLFFSAKANKELVQFGEALKTHVAPDFKKTLFGDNTSAISTSIADSVQSDSTQAIVKKLRRHIAIENVNKGK